MTNKPKALPGSAELEDDDLIRLPEVVRKTTLSEAEIYRRMRGGSFPVPLRLSTQVVAWRVGDIREWNRSHPSASDLGPREAPPQAA